jgi:hypothetical protein
MKLVLIWIVASLATLSVSQSVNSKPVTLKISVLSSGAVFLNGKSISVKALGETLQSAKGNNGQVWYYRENAGAVPPPQAMEVIKLVLANKLPISFSSKPDFSDYIDERGESHPRSGK